MSAATYFVATFAVGLVLLGLVATGLACIVAEAIHRIARSRMDSER
jgi:CHASE1-domain containing sensor protein